MNDSTVPGLTLQQKRKLVQISYVETSVYPYRLFVKRTGVLLNTFQTEAAMLAYLEQLADIKLLPHPCVK